MPRGRAIPWIVSCWPRSRQRGSSRRPRRIATPWCDDCISTSWVCRRRRRKSTRTCGTPRQRPTRPWSIGCWPRPTMASGGRGAGSIWPAMPTPTAMKKIASVRSGPIAIGSSTPSTPTCRSTSLRSTNWRATCCPPRTSENRVATGFHRNTMLNEEGGIDPLEFRYYAVVDRINTTGTVWLGLTVGCAQCHTHKYDPIPQRDYYRLMAFLNNADEPTVDVPRGDIAGERARIEAQIAMAEAELPKHFPLEGEFRWHDVTPISAGSEAGAQTVASSDGTIRISGPTPERDTTTVVLDSDLARKSRPYGSRRLRIRSCPSRGRAVRRTETSCSPRSARRPRRAIRRPRPNRSRLLAPRPMLRRAALRPSKPWTPIPKPAGRSRVRSLGTCRARPFFAWANRGSASDKRGGRSGWNNNTAAAIRWAGFASGLASASKTIVPRPCGARII